MHSKLFLPILVIGLLLSRQGFSQRIFKESLPPDYNCTGCVLVILKNDTIGEPQKGPSKRIYSNVNEMVEKKLIANYDGKSIFITQADLDSNKLYSDVKIYRFIMGVKLYYYQGSMPGSGSKTITYDKAGLDIHLYDRFAKKGYPQMSNYPSWSKNLEKVAEALNKLLKP